MQDDAKNETADLKTSTPGLNNSITIPSRSRRPWSTVAVFEDAGGGRLLETDLTNKGFAARSYDDKVLRTFLFLRPPDATVQVQVRANDFETVAYFLDHNPAMSALLQKAIRCPSCGSLRVQYPQMTRKFFLPTLLLHLGIIFRVITHEAYCESCHWLWGLPKKRVSLTAEAQAANPVPLK